MYFSGYYILYTDPVIVSFMGKNGEDPLIGAFSPKKENFSLLSQKIAQLEWFQPAHVLEHLPWWSQPWHRMLRFWVKQKRYSLFGRTHHLITNASDEEQARKTFFISGGHFNSNIYVNESIYRVLDEPKQYDAIYTAQLAQFKRHYLAKDVQRLMVVSYGGDLHAFCPDLKHADFNREFIPRPELARKYNQSYAGLCLSAVEGAMFSSCEYLLSGIPVVTTLSKGGRDEFFDQHNSIVVPSDSKSVAQAVEQWKENPPEPEQIRAQTLLKMRAWRLEYCKYISNLIHQDGGSQVEPEYLMEQYFSAPDGIAKRFVRWDDLATMEQSEFLQQFQI